MSKELILASNHGNGYYNGTSDDGWNFKHAERISEISDEFIFETIQDIEDLEEYDTKLKYWYDIVNIKDQVLKPKCPYSIYNGFLPIIKYGCKNEICAYCGTNILAEEPYLVWTLNRKYCLHCVVNQMIDVPEIFGNTPANLKEEWKANGKLKAITCMERM